MSKRKRKTFKDCIELFRNVPRGYVMGIEAMNGEACWVDFMGYDTNFCDEDGDLVEERLIQHLYFTNHGDDKSEIITVKRDGYTLNGNKLVLVPYNEGKPVPITWDAFYIEFAKVGVDDFMKSLKKGDILVAVEKETIWFGIFNNRGEYNHEIYCNLVVVINKDKLVDWQHHKCSIVDLLYSVDGIYFGDKTSELYIVDDNTHIATPTEENIFIKIIVEMFKSEECLDETDTHIITITKNAIVASTSIPLNLRHQKS